MIAAELRGGSKTTLNEALGWIGSRVDDIYGAGIGRLEDVWIDPGTGVPRWLLVKEGSFGGRTTLIPFEDATAGAGHVWIPYERDIVHRAPEVEPGAPLTQQLESELRHHYATSTATAVPHGHAEVGVDEGRPEQAAAAGVEPAPGLQPAEPPPRPQQPAAPSVEGAGSAGAEASGEPSRAAREAVREPAQDDDRRPAAEPISLQLDRGYRIEIELSGGLRISAEVEGIRLLPSERDAP